MSDKLHFSDSDIVHGDKQIIRTNGGAYHESRINTGGGEYNEGSKNTFIGNDNSNMIVGSPNASITPGGLAGEDLRKLFDIIYRKIEVRPEDKDVDKAEITTPVKSIQDEVSKGDAANIVKIERWLNRLVDLAPDILSVTVTTLVNPVAGVALAVQKVAEKFIKYVHTT